LLDATDLIIKLLTSPRDVLICKKSERQKVAFKPAFINEPTDEDSKTGACMFSLYIKVPPKEVSGEFLFLTSLLDTRRIAWRAGSG